MTVQGALNRVRGKAPDPEPSPHTSPEVVRIPIGATVRGLVPDFNATRDELFCGMAEEVATLCSLPAGAQQDLHVACSLSRLGFSVIPPRLLQLRRPLSAAERDVIQRYTMEGRDAVHLLGWPRAAEIISQVQVRWDAGTAVSLAARVLTVIHALDAMTSHRAYRPAMEWERAVDELRRCAGTQFDPHVVDALVRVVPKRAPDSL
jgi:HD-GYP domain-containing protein (c-di-GMP phosphodiesterase class II)